jgi:lysophospholipase L1-like esterase
VLCRRRGGGLYYGGTTWLDQRRLSPAIGAAVLTPSNPTVAPAPLDPTDGFAERFNSPADGALPTGVAAEPEAEIHLPADPGTVPRSGSAHSELGGDTPNETTAQTDERRPGAAEPLSALQIGDSHTSADFFSGEVRQVVQSKYGRGGIGYMPAGRPKGFGSSVLHVSVTSGWTYKSLLNRHANPAEFRFSGYNAIASGPNENIKIKLDDPLEFDSIEIEATARPGGGAIDIEVNGRLERHRDLEARVAEPVLIKIAASSQPAMLREVSITTGGKGTVTLSSISIYNERHGLTYNSVGYSGATIDILNKLRPEQFAAALRRINPRIVVLSFGTNEAANKTLDLARYNDNYERVVGNVKAALPDAVLIIIGPPDFNQMSSACHERPNGANAICRETPTITSPLAQPPNVNAPTAESKVASESQCAWHTPAKLQQVREVQRNIAERHGFIYWNWGSIMPAECGANEWFKKTPPLMSPDHVHFTSIGYRKSADEFIPLLLSIIDRIQAGSNDVSHH